MVSLLVGPNLQIIKPFSGSLKVYSSCLSFAVCPLLISFKFLISHSLFFVFFGTGRISPGSPLPAFYLAVSIRERAPDFWGVWLKNKEREWEKHKFKNLKIQKRSIYVLIRFENCGFYVLLN